MIKLRSISAIYGIILRLKSLIKESNVITYVFFKKIIDLEIQKRSRSKCWLWVTVFLDHLSMFEV